MQTNNIKSIVSQHCRTCVYVAALTEYRQRSSGRLRPVGGERRGGEVVSYYTPLVTATETSVVTLLSTGHRDSD